MITLCAWCKKVRNERGHWERVGGEHSDAIVTHGICPKCLEKQNPEICDEILKEDTEVV